MGGGEWGGGGGEWEVGVRVWVKDETGVFAIVVLRSPILYDFIWIESVGE